MRIYKILFFFTLYCSIVNAQSKKEEKSALLVMDMQYYIINTFPDEIKVAKRQVSQAIAHARTNNISVIYVTVNFRADAPEISPTNTFLEVFV